MFMKKLPECVVLVKIKENVQINMGSKTLDYQVMAREKFHPNFCD